MSNKKGEGTIRKRKENLYEARYTYNGSQRSAYYKSEKEAKEGLKKILANITLDNYFEPPKIKLEDWMKTWLFEYKKPVIKLKTFESYEQIIRVYITPFLGKILLIKLDTDTIQRALNQMLVSVRTIKYTYTILKMALKKAKELKLIKDMPTDGIVLPKGEKKEINILENDKIKIFLRAIIENRYGLAFLMALFTGMRRGEILALTWGDIDFENKIINVNKTLNVIKCFDNDKIEYRTIINSSKTVNSNRVLPILPILITPLKTHYTRSQIHGWGSVYDFVFTNKFGKNVNPRKFTQYFYDIFKKCEIKRINFHALRHTFASMAIDKGVNPKTLSNILGHSSISFTLDTYCHVTIQQKQREISKIDDFENLLGYEKGYKPKKETLQILETRSAPSGTRTQDPLIKSHKIQASDPL